MRLRSVDVTADVYKPLSSTESGYDYADIADVEKFRDNASEADSEEGLSNFSGSDVDAEDFKNKILSSRPFLHTAV